MKNRSRYAVALAAAVLSAAGVSATQAAWEPTRPVEIIVPAAAVPTRWHGSSRA